VSEALVTTVLQVETYLTFVRRDARWNISNKWYRPQSLFLVSCHFRFLRFRYGLAPADDFIGRPEQSCFV